jgi:MSHA pilin protein MshA
VPRFIDLSDAAQDAVVKNIAGALTSASSLNHANNIAFDAGLATATPDVVTTCRQVADLLEGGLDPKYVIQAGRGSAVSGGGIVNEGGISECQVAYDSNNNGTYNATDTPPATFTAYGVR